MKLIHMDDGDKQNKRNNIAKKQKDDVVQRYESVPSSVLQSFWVRCRSILPDITDGKFMESELRYVLYCGMFFWIVYLLIEMFK
jgi:hypothetical protein